MRLFHSFLLQLLLEGGDINIYEMAELKLQQSHFELFAQRARGSFHLVEPRSVVEIEQPVHLRQMPT